MSGYKHATITISQEEYRRLHELDMQRRSIPKNANDEINARNEALLKAYQQIEKRQEDYESAIACLNHEMAEAESEMARAVLSIQEDYYQQLVEATQEFQNQQDEIQEILEERTRYFEEVIQSNQNNFQSRLDELFQQITSITKEQDKKEAYTRKWIENSHFLLNFIDQNYDHQKFFPKELDRLSQRLVVAQHDLSRGFVDSGLQFAQDTFLIFSELRISLEEKSSEWDALYEIVKSEVDNIYQQVLETPKIPAIGIDGEELQIEIDLEFWSCGRYTVVRNALDTLLSMMEEKKREINFEDLHRLRKEIIPKFRQEFDETIFQARQNALNSQLKINVAYLAMKALEKHGFSLDSAQFDNDDQRDAFSAQLLGIDGSHILLHVTPTENNLKTNNLIVQTLDDNIHTEDEFIHRWQEINLSLQQAGVEIGPVHIGSDSLENQNLGNIPVGQKLLSQPGPYYLGS